IRAISPTDIWAVGNFALIEHWDGNQWSIVPSPNGSYIRGVAALSSTDVWAVGYYWNCQGSPCGWRTLTEHYADPCTFTPTPSPTPSPSPSPSPSSSPTITPT